jgi:hypothetical protein
MEAGTRSKVSRLVVLLEVYYPAEALGLSLIFPQDFDCRWTFVYCARQFIDTLAQNLLIAEYRTQ